jgi:hypothetical protein
MQNREFKTQNVETARPFRPFGPFGHWSLGFGHSIPLCRSR